MSSKTAWFIALGFALAVVCVSAVTIVIAGGDDARALIILVPPLLYALAALVRALGGTSDD